MTWGTVKGSTKLGEKWRQPLRCWEGRFQEDCCVQAGVIERGQEAPGEKNDGKPHVNGNLKDRFRHLAKSLEFNYLIVHAVLSKWKIWQILPLGKAKCVGKEK